MKSVCSWRLNKNQLEEAKHLSLPAQVAVSVQTAGSHLSLHYTLCVKHRRTFSMCLWDSPSELLSFSFLCEVTENLSDSEQNQLQCQSHFSENS